MSELIVNGETIASISIVRADGLYGAHVTVYGGGFTGQDVPCHFSTLGGLLSHVADLVSQALKTRKGCV